MGVSLRQEQQLRLQQQQALATTAVLGTVATTLTIGLGASKRRWKLKLNQDLGSFRTRRHPILIIGCHDGKKSILFF